MSLPLSPEARAAVDRLHERRQHQAGRQAVQTLLRARTHRLRIHAARRAVAGATRPTRRRPLASPKAEQVHAHLVAVGAPVGPLAISTALGMAGSTVNWSLNRLHEDGRVTRHPGGTWAAIREDAA